MNASQFNWLAGHACHCIDFIVVQRLIGICDPGHFFRTCPEIRRWDITTGSDEILAIELKRESTCDPFQFRFRILAPVDFDATFGTAEWNINDRTLVSHQRSKCDHFIFVHIDAEPDPAFGGQLVIAVLCSPTSDDFDLAVIKLDRERKTANEIAFTNLRNQIGIVFRQLGGLVKVPVDLLGKTYLRHHSSLQFSQQLPI